MNHRRSDVRAAVFARQRSQGHLRAVTVTVGIAGVVTAGAVAAILPGSTHASASSQGAAKPATTASPASTAGSGAPAASAAGTAGRATRHRHHRARKARAAAPATSAPAAPVPTPAATVAPPQTTSGGS